MTNSIKLTVLTLLMASVAVAQIPNSGFENWTSAGSYANPSEWGTMNNTTSGSGIYTATKGSPGNPGTSFLKLTSRTIGANVVNGIAVSGIIDSVTMTPKSGFPYSSRPLNLTGKWQHMIYGSSQGSIQIILTRWDSNLKKQVPVGSGNVILSGMAMSWANFSIPISYVDNGNPDTCIIVLKASGNSPSNNDYLWVDNLAFTGSATGINLRETVSSGITVFPNPATDVVNFSIPAQHAVVVEIFNNKGQMVNTRQMGMLQGDITHSIDVSELSEGIYLLRITGDKARYTTTLIIQ